MLALGVAGILVVLMIVLIRWAQSRATPRLPGSVSDFIDGVRSKRIPVSRDSLLQMTVVTSAIPGTKTFLGEPLSDEQTDSVAATLRDIYEARHGTVDVADYEVESFEDFDRCAGGVADPGYKYVYNAATNMCDQIPLDDPAAAVSTDCQEGKIWDATRAKCVWKKDSPWQRQTDCENRGKFWDHDYVVDAATGQTGKCMTLTPEREARRADPVYQERRRRVAMIGESKMRKAGKDPKIVTATFQNQLIAAGFNQWKGVKPNTKLCNAAGECYVPWLKADQDRAVKAGIAQPGELEVSPWQVDAKPIDNIVNDAAAKLGYTEWAWYRNGKKGLASGMKCKPWPAGQDPDPKQCKWMGNIAKEWAGVVATRGVAATGAVEAALTTATTGGFPPGSFQLGRTEHGWGKNKGKVCRPGQKDCLTHAQVKTEFAALVARNVATTGKKEGKGCSYPGAFELGYMNWGYGKTEGLCCNANGKCLNKGQIEKARANTAGAVSTRKYMCYKDGKPFEYKNVDINWAGGAGDAAWACNKKFASCGGKCTSDPKSAGVIIPAKSFCTWDGKDQTSAGWYKVGGNCCLKDTCTCRNMAPGNGKNFPTTDPTHNGGKCAKKGAAAKTPAAKTPAAKTPAPATAAAKKGPCHWDSKDQPDYVKFGGKCCTKKGCWCVDPTTGKNGYPTTDKRHNNCGGKAATTAVKAPAGAAAKAPPAKGPCHWDSKDQPDYVKFGGKCCTKNGCWCVDPTTGKNGQITQDKRHNNGKCAVTLQNAIAAIDARDRKAAADKAAAAKAAEARKAAEEAAKKAAAKEAAFWKRELNSS